MRWDVCVLAQLACLRSGKRQRHDRTAALRSFVRLPAAQNTPEFAGMMQRKQSCQIVCSSHTPAGTIVFHPIPNNGKDIALHAPAAGGLLALVGQRWLPSCSLVIRYQGMAVVTEIRKQPPAVFLFRRVKCAFNGRFHYGNSFLRLALAEQLQDEFLEFGIVQIGAHSLVPVEQVKLASAVRHHVSLEPQASLDVPSPS